MKQNKYIKNIHLRSKQQVEDEKEQQNQAKSKVELRDFNYAASSYEGFDHISLREIHSLKLSESGSRGVLFIETAKGAIVLKLSGQVGVELFLNKLTHALGIQTTHMRCLKWCDEEMEEIKNQILYAASSDEILLYRLKHKLKVAYFEMIEYVPGIQLDLLSGARAQIAFTKERLLSLGQILAFDILINNGDRFPLPIWRSVGNAYNVILKVQNTTCTEMFNISNTNVDFDKFYAIDPQTILQVQGGNNLQENILQTYYKKVKQFLSDLCSDIVHQESTSLESLKAFIEEHTQYQLTNEELLIISRGILQELIIIQEFGIEKIKDILKSTIIPDEQDWLGNYNTSLKLVHIQFYEQMIKIFIEIRLSNLEAFKNLQ